MKTPIPFAVICMDAKLAGAPKIKAAPRYLANCHIGRDAFSVVIYATSRPDAIKTARAWKREFGQSIDGEIVLGKIAKYDTKRNKSK